MRTLFHDVLDEAKPIKMRAKDREEKGKGNDSSSAGRSGHHSTTFFHENMMNNSLKWGGGGGCKMEVIFIQGTLSHICQQTDFSSHTGTLFVSFPTLPTCIRCVCSSQIDILHQKKVIREGFEELVQNNDFVVVEGTGHTGESWDDAQLCCHDRELPPTAMGVHPG